MAFFGVFLLLCLSVSRLVWLKIELVLSVFCHPATEFFALKSVFFRCLEYFNMATTEICWLVGWLVGWSIRFLWL